MIDRTTGIPEALHEILVNPCLCRATRARMRAADSGNPNTAINDAADNANNVRQKRPNVAEDTDNWYFYVKSDLFFIFVLCVKSS